MAERRPARLRGIKPTLNQSVLDHTPKQTQQGQGERKARSVRSGWRAGSGPVFLAVPG